MKDQPNQLNYSALVNELGQIRAQNQNQQAQINEVSQYIQELTASLTALRNTVQALTPPTPTPPVPTPLAPAPPAPTLTPEGQPRVGNLIKAHKDIFNGEKEFFDTWLLGIRGVLAEDGAALPTPSQKFWWIYSKLGS